MLPNDISKHPRHAIPEACAPIAQHYAGHQQGQPYTVYFRLSIFNLESRNETHQVARLSLATVAYYLGGGF